MRFSSDSVILGRIVRLRECTFHCSHASGFEVLDDRDFRMRLDFVLRYLSGITASVDDDRLNALKPVWLLIFPEDRRLNISSHCF